MEFYTSGKPYQPKENNFLIDTSIKNGPNPDFLIKQSGLRPLI